MKRLVCLALPVVAAIAVAATAIPSSAQAPHRAFLLRTAITFAEDAQPKGRILQGSFLGEAAFCRGGSFTDRPGRRGVLKRVRCEDGTLTIRFDPGPDSFAQSSAWSVVEGTGAYEGLEGRGWMAVRVRPTGRASATGRETFAGRLR